MITLTLVYGANDKKSVYPKGTSLNVRQSPSLTGTILINVPSGVLVGTVLGEWTGKDDQGYKWYCVTLVQPINGKITGSVREDVVSFSVAPVNTNNTNNTNTSEYNDDPDYISKVEKLIKNSAAIDVVIYKRLVIIYAQMKKAQEIGVNVSQQMVVFNGLLSRYKERQQLLKQSQAVQTETPAYPLYQWISDKFGLGAIQIPLAVIIAGVAIATLALAYAVTKAMEPAMKGQPDDLKITGEFQKFFEQLPADKQAIIKEDLEAQLKDAYEKGAKDNSMGIGDMLKWGAVGFIGIFLWNQFQEQKDKRELKKVIRKEAA